MEFPSCRQFLQTYFKRPTTIKVIELLKIPYDHGPSKIIYAKDTTSLIHHTFVLVSMIYFIFNQIENKRNTTSSEQSQHAIEKL